MAEAKQYITQDQENGIVSISEDVIAAIAIHAANEVEGVAGLSGKPGADIAEIIGKKNWGKGMRISVGENNSVSIDCDVVVKYGHSVVNVAKAVQANIVSAVEPMTGVTVTLVNVNVCGIARA